ncbi:MAG: hypothetical protein WBA76_08485 [Phormidesmis sp.]
MQPFQDAFQSAQAIGNASKQHEPLPASPHLDPIQRPSKRSRLKSSSLKHKAKALHSQPAKPVWQKGWVRTTVFTGAAAGMVLPLVHKNVTSTHQNPSAETAASPTAAAAARSRSQTKAMGKGEAVVPQASAPNRANFSATTSSAVKAAAAPPALITKGKDGNWTLSQRSGVEQTAGQAAIDSQPMEAQFTEAQRASTAIAQLAQETNRSSSAQLGSSACKGGSCGGLAYIDAQLPKARQQVKAADNQIQKFEATQAQQDIDAYRQVLTARMAEIDQQKSQLTIGTTQTRQQIDGIKTRLTAIDTAGLDVAMADRALFQDPTYQAVWAKLVRSETSLLEEFSSANIDATALNEIYGDYQFQQQALERAAAAALGNYMSSPSQPVPDAIQQNPDALSLLQSLTTAAYEYQVQLLRLNTIDQIKQKLSVRQSQLGRDVGQYEQLQRQKLLAQQQVNQYEQAREKILTEHETEQIQAIASGTAASSSRSDKALARVKELAPQLPEGSATQLIAFVVLAAGAIAAISARHTAKQTVLPPQWALEGGKLLSVPAPELASPELASPGIAISPASVLPELDNFFAGIASNEPAEAFEQRMLKELQEMTGQSARLVNEVPAASYSAEDSLTIEVMTRDLDNVLHKAAPTVEGSLLSEINERAKASVKLPLKEVDAFADHAVRWILKDLGLTTVATR